MTIRKSFGISLMLYSVVAWLASGTLTLERLALFADPGHKASCDFGLFVSCTSLMKTDQAALFGFPNPFLGIVGFAVTGVIGLVIALTAKHGEVLPKWFYWLLQAGVTFAMALVGFFFYTSVFDVMTLCPWCMVVWAMTIPMFLHTTAFNIAQGQFGNAPVRLREAVTGWWWIVAVIAYIAVVLAILLRFQEYIFS